MLNGIPYAIRPTWLDPDQIPIRNTLPDALRRARRQAHAMTTGASGPEAPP